MDEKDDLPIIEYCIVWKKIKNIESTKIFCDGSVNVKGERVKEFDNLRQDYLNKTELEKLVTKLYNAIKEIPSEERNRKHGKEWKASYLIRHNKEELKLNYGDKDEIKPELKKLQNRLEEIYLGVYIIHYSKRLHKYAQCTQNEILEEECKNYINKAIFTKKIGEYQ